MSALTLTVPLDGLTVVAPRPLVVTERSCDRVIGLTVKPWRKVARAMVAAGLPVTETGDGLTALVSDVETYMREHAPRPAVRERAARVEGTDDDDLSADLGSAA